MDKTSVDADFVRLLNDYRGTIERVSRLYAAKPADREDLVQEIVYQLWRAFPSYRRESSVLTWVYRIALNTAITGLRRRTRQPVLLPLELASAVTSSPPSSAKEARISLLYRVIQQLDSVDRALLMCYLDELSYKEIANVLGLSETNVGARLHRTKAKLQDLVRGMEAFDGS